MAAAKKSTNVKSMSQWNISWKTFFIALSIAANIGFVVVFTTMMTSHALDELFMREGLSRYCATENDKKFANISEKNQARRDYTCGNGEAEQYFNDGLTKYLQAKGLVPES